MSVLRDWIDWLGGYPFEVAKPEDVFDFFRERGLQLQKLKTCGGTVGCNEFVFEADQNRQFFVSGLTEEAKADRY
jgi:2-polyprenyl-6-hydroxyphenyl methylase/3-demethylubiquinone-9 3-methyltransferase